MSVSVMQWRLGAARRIQALIFLLSHRLDASRHFLANFSVILDHIWHLNFTDCFGGKSFTLDSDNGLHTNPLQIFPFPLSLGTFTLKCVSHPTHPSNKGQPRYFVIYHYIIAYAYTAIARKLSCLEFLSFDVKVIFNCQYCTNACRVQLYLAQPICE